MDAITLLKDDHKAVEALFKRFEKAGDRAHVEKRDLVDRIIDALSVHASVEEQLFYPVVRAAVPGAESTTLESLEEHHIVKWVLSELDSMPPEAERFDAKVTVLIENVRHHVKEEEQDLFPMVRNELGRSALGELGEAMAEAKKTAPHHPHPRSPDTPPGNILGGSKAAVTDRIGDTVSGLAQGSVAAVNDIVAMVLRRPKPRVSPTGSRSARATATKVRSDVGDVARSARQTGKRAVHSAERTAHDVSTGAASTTRAAKAGAKSTATSARTSTKRAVATAKRGATTTGRTAHAGAKTSVKTAKRSARQTTAVAKRSAGGA